jgi:hypothetical protein
MSGSDTLTVPSCHLNGLPPPDYQFSGHVHPRAESFNYTAKAIVGYRGAIETLASPSTGKVFKVNHPLLLTEVVSIGGPRFNLVSGNHLLSGSATGLLTSYLPTINRVAVGSQNFASLSLGEAFESFTSTDQYLRDKILDLESDLFFESLDRTKIANVGATLAEFTQLKGIFSRGILTFQKLPRSLGSDLSIGSIISTIESLAEWWLTYSYEFKPLIGLGMDLFHNMGQSGKTGSTFMLKSKVKYQDLLTTSKDIQGGKVIWGTAVSPPYRCTVPPSYTDGGSVRIQTLGFGEELYSYQFGVPGSGAPGSDRISCTVAAKLAMQWQVTTDPYFLAVQLGLLPRSMGWEVLPFSFVIDWFSKVGEFLTRVDEVDSGTYTVVGANYALDLRYSIKSTFGAHAEARAKVRSSHMQPNGEIASGLGEFFVSPTQLRYLPQDIESGTLVKKFDSRFLNAVSLLTVLSTTLRRGKHSANSETLSSVENSRLIRALQKLGL